MYPTVRSYPNAIILDDGYFAIQIAYNIGVHFFSSFDGIHVTNGYHLLWNWLLGVLALLLSPFTTAKGWFAFASLAAVATLALAISCAYFRRWWQRLFVVVVVFWTASMTEAVLLPLVLLYLFDRLLRHEREFLTSSLDLVMVGLVPMIRIDATLILAALGACLLVTDRRKGGLMLAALAAGLCLQLLTMKLLFGAFFSTSSMVLGARIGDLVRGTLWNPEKVWSSHLQTVCTLSSFALAAGGLAAARTIADERRRRSVVAIIACCSLFLFSHLLIGSMREWYWTAPLLSLYLVAGRAIEERGAVAVRMAMACSLLVIGLAVVDVVSMAHEYADARDYSRTFLDLVDRTVPQSESVFQEDASGFIGYWAQARVVNGDGLVNSIDYVRRMQGGALAGYLEEENICFLIRNWPLERGMIVSLGGLEVRSDDAYLLIAPPDDLEIAAPFQFKLYLLKEERCRRFVPRVDQSTIGAENGTATRYVG